MIKVRYVGYTTAIIAWTWCATDHNGERGDQSHDASASIESNAAAAGETHDMRVIGVDCATDDSKVGIALGVCEAGNLRVLSVEVCSRERHAAIVAAEWLEGASEALVAIDVGALQSRYFRRSFR